MFPFTNEARLPNIGLSFTAESFGTKAWKAALACSLGLGIEPGFMAKLIGQSPLHPALPLRGRDIYSEGTYGAVPPREGEGDLVVPGYARTDG
jgi:hypothetical protein